MHLRLNSFQSYRLLLFGGYLALFALRSSSKPQAVPGLLGIVPGYVQAAERLHPLTQLSLRFGIPAATLGRLALLLIFAFLALVTFYTLQSARHKLSQPADLRAIIVGVLLFSVPLMFLPYILSRDIYSYIVYGRIAAIHAANPELTTPIAYSNDPFFQYLVSWKDTPSVYGPVWTLVSHALTLAVEWVGGTLWNYLLAYKLLMFGVHLANTLLIWRILGGWKPEQQTWGTLFYAWNPVALIEFVGSAHNDGLMLCLVLLALYLARQKHWRWAIVALVGAALVKWIAVILLPLYAILLLRQLPAWPARAQRAVEIGALVLVAVVVLHLPYGQISQAVFAPVTTQTAMKAENSIGALAISAVRKLSPQLGLAPNDVAAWNSAAQSSVAWGSKAIFMLAWLVALVAIWRRPTFERFVQSSWWLFLIILLVAPVFRTWYVTWPLMLAPLLSWRSFGQITDLFTASAPLVYIHWGPTGFSDLLIYLPVIALLAYQLWRKLSNRDRRLFGGSPLAPVASGSRE